MNKRVTHMHFTLHLHNLESATHLAVKQTHGQLRNYCDNNKNHMIPFSFLCYPVTLVTVANT